MPTFSVTANTIVTAVTSLIERYHCIFLASMVADVIQVRFAVTGPGRDATRVPNAKLQVGHAVSRRYVHERFNSE